MAYVVDRVVICDAIREPEKHYQLLTGGRSKLAQGRRPSVRFLASAKDVQGGIAGIVGKEAGLVSSTGSVRQRVARGHGSVPERAPGAQVAAGGAFVMVHA